MRYFTVRAACFHDVIVVVRLPELTYPGDLLAFGAADPAALPVGAAPALERYVDFGDADLLSAALHAVTAPGASLVVASCSTGEGRDRAGNIANLVATWVPHAHVVAPTVTSNRRARPVRARGVLHGRGSRARSARAFGAAHLEVDDRQLDDGKDAHAAVASATFKDVGRA